MFSPDLEARSYNRRMVRAWRKLQIDQANGKLGHEASMAAKDAVQPGQPPLETPSEAPAQSGSAADLQRIRSTIDSNNNGLTQKPLHPDKRRLRKKERVHKRWTLSRRLQRLRTESPNLSQKTSLLEGADVVLFVGSPTRHSLARRRHPN